MTDIPYIDRLRDDLVSGIGERRRRSTRRRRTALVGAPIAVAAATAAATIPGGTSPALAIEDRGEWIELRIADAAAGAPQMQRELRDAGIEAEVRVVAVTPSLVGQWACIAEIADGDPAGEDVDGDGPNGRSYVVRLQEVRYTPETVSIRRDFAAGTQDGQLVFVAGRAAQEGEQASGDPCRGRLR
jgi:hypothetical protein